MSSKCDDCGRELNIDPVKDPKVDWVTVACSNCGETKQISMVRTEIQNYE